MAILSEEVGKVKKGEWFLIAIVVALLIVALSLYAHADTLNMSCNVDPVATGYRLKGRILSATAPWVLEGDSPTCAFSVQRSDQPRHYIFCSYNATDEKCRDKEGIFTDPVAATLNPSGATLQ